MDYVRRDGAAEILVNRFGEVWVEYAGRLPEPEQDARLTRGYFERLARILSNDLNIVDFWKKPILAAILPGGHRLQLNIGPFVQSGIAVSIRVNRNIAFDLAGYSIDEATRGVILDAFTHRKNIIISGGTNTGKTQFMNALMRQLDPNERVIAAEDTPEVILRHVPNRVEFTVNRQATETDIQYRDVIDSMTRMRPDRIVVGEMSIQNTWILLRLLNTGHGGLLTTIHADSPAGAFDAIERNIQLANLPIDGIRTFFMDHIDLVLQIARKPGATPGAFTRYLSDMYRRPLYPAPSAPLHVQAAQ